MIVVQMWKCCIRCLWLNANEYKEKDLESSFQTPVSFPIIFPVRWYWRQNYNPGRASLHMFHCSSDVEVYNTKLWQPSTDCLGCLANCWGSTVSGNTELIYASTSFSKHFMVIDGNTTGLKSMRVHVSDFSGTCMITEDFNKRGTPSCIRD